MNTSIIPYDFDFLTSISVFISNLMRFANSCSEYVLKIFDENLYSNFPPFVIWMVMASAAFLIFDFVRGR